MTRKEEIKLMIEDFIVDMRKKKMPDGITSAVLKNMKQATMTNFTLGTEALTKEEVTEIFDTLDISLVEVEDAKVHS